MVKQAVGARPFVIQNTFRHPLRRSAFAVAKPALERVLALPALNDFYEAIQSFDDDRLDTERALDLLGATYQVDDGDRKRIPTSGPLIVVSNHPYGGLDGVILLTLLRRIRPDVRFLANHFLGMVPSLRGSLILVNPFGGAAATAGNIAGLRQAIRFVREGGLLAVFPAGEVSHARITNLLPKDPQWSGTLARIIRATQAPLLPIFIEGRNSIAFQLAGLIHKRLRTAMLPRELLNKRGRTVAVRVGNVIPFKKLDRFTDDGELTAYIRVRTYILKGRPSPIAGQPAEMDRQVRPAAPPVAEPRPCESVQRDVASLPDDRVLLTSGAFDVMVASADEVPSLLHEIGRQRELAFRKVGEGAGKPIDLDRFDEYYLHLFAWDRDAQRLVGAYRLGQTDVILPRLGVEGLYTRTLFKFDRKLMKQIDPALEMGRSFVCLEYQKSYSPLMLLWKGIGQFVARNPRYRMLFGPVSISNEYRSMSRQLLMNFLKVNRALPRLERLIRPNHRPRFRPIRDWDPRMTGRVVRDINDVDELISEIEADRLGVPVLLRQYLKLDAKLLGFSVDPQFGDVLDGLLLADVTGISRAVLNKYLGREQAAQYVAFHGLSG